MPAKRRQKTKGKSKHVKKKGIENARAEQCWL